MKNQSHVENQQSYIAAHNEEESDNINTIAMIPTDTQRIYGRGDGIDARIDKWYLSGTSTTSRNI